MSEKNFKAASFVLLRKENQVLLMKRANTGYCDGMYSMPAGHIETGESPTEAIVREAQEEVGVVLNVDAINCVYTQYNGSNKNDYANFFFVANQWGGEIANLEPEKCSELYWCDQDNLPENLTPEVAEMFSSIKHGKTYGEVDIEK